MESLASVGYAGVAELDAGKAELDVESSRRGFGGRYQPGDAAQFSGSRLQPPPASEPEWGPRSIVRKATIELTCDDVRTAFAKASQLVSEARGEFVGQSALSGSDQNAYATLTLRVEAERLDSFLTELRALGTVVSENASGEDITTQVVDLDARLRNEQRVEQELLDLLASRQDAPLADVLKLRTSISDVRGSIERMQAQRLHLGRLTRLATVLLILRAKDAPPPAEHTLSEYFGNVISRAWTAGVHFLADTAGLIVAVVIGAAPWIVLAGLIYWLFRRRHSA